MYPMYDIKKVLLCDSCNYNQICKYKDNFVSVRNKLMELTSETDKLPDTSDESVGTVVIDNEKNPPEIPLEPWMCLNIHCGYYNSKNMQRDPYIAPLKKSI